MKRWLLVPLLLPLAAALAVALLNLRVPARFIPGFRLAR